ncbi:leucine-rich repeat protein [Bacteroides sp.]|uniref:leucine-rich repeat protein n=1 Tax=Bacteroides sp. TaxID=29523 RepID=UPI0025825CBF|nr:leucine-rich repeat protein [Bacteroides sp.]
MKLQMKTKYVLLPWLALLGVGCQDSPVVPANTETNEELRFDAEIEQVYVTRVNDNGFTDGDQMGVYVVDFDGQGNPGNLQTTGNRADNVRFVYRQDMNKWKGDVSIYWKDERTPIDAYGYYPYISEVNDVSAYPFTVAANQAETGKDSGTLGAYEASDFLWAKATGVNPGEVIRLNYQHLMAGIQVTLKAGEGFATEEWNKLDKSVGVTNTLTQAQINLRDGKVSPVGTETQTIMSIMSGTDFRAVIIPQVVEPNQTLLSITVDGQNYNFVREQGMTYHSGKLHKFTIQVDAPPTGDYRFTLLDEAVTAWENDEVSHEAEARSYVCVHVAEPGQLKECIAAAGKDYRTIHNLKLTGSITEDDFIFMRDEMNSLEALNLKEVKIKNVYNDFGIQVDDIIPNDAFVWKYSLTHIVFPDNLCGISRGAFRETQLTGSLSIPEGVTYIGDNAFRNVTTLTGSLTLPSTLKQIGKGSFEYCGFSSDLHFPESLVSIGERAFIGCSDITGHLHLPDNLIEIGTEAFAEMSNIRGDIVIPDKISTVKCRSFYQSGFDGNIYLPEGLVEIEGHAFANTSIGGEVVLPTTLRLLGIGGGYNGGAFANTNITHIVFPKNLQLIGDECFSQCTYLQDTIKIPSAITKIGYNTFAGCNQIEALVLPDNLQTIENSAFSGCYSLNLVQCLSDIPPVIADGEWTFGGVAKDNFSVVVPANAVDAYRNAEGWREFKRITAYRNFVCRPYHACALNAGLEKKELILNADGAWKVTRIPSWCHLSQTSGNQKTALTLTIDRLEHGQGNRQDSIVFSLDDGAYTTYCTVEQYDYHYEENETVTLQTASQGQGIDIFWVGDGFDAQDIAEGTYLKTIGQQVEYFFGIEPYKTYRDYFNVHATIALSQESSIGTLNTLRDVKFHSTLADCKTRMVVYPEQVEAYMAQYSGISADILAHSLVTVCLNTSLYEGVCYMYPGGAATAFCPHSTEAYPYDARGIVQHEAGGHGFGKLGDEYIYHEAFIQTCQCTDGCGHVEELQTNQSMGFFRNLSLNGTYGKNEWRHLIFDDRYSDIVDIYEGGYFHSRGVYRSEDNSCMNNNIPYYSTFSRQVIVERIMELAGEPFDFEQFVAKDSRQPGNTYIGTTRVDERPSMSYRHRPPVLMKKNPYLN